MQKLPETMRAVVLTGHGGFDKLVYREDFPTPRPSADDIVVKVGACGLNNTDVNTRIGWYSETVQQGVTESDAKQGFSEADTAQGGWGGTAIRFPRVQGADVAGTVAALGANASSLQVGERVLIDPWILDPERPLALDKAKFFGSEVDGGFAEYAVAPARNVHRIESDLSDAQLATFACAYTTAENLVEHVALAAGETIAISGASGGVGSAAVQLCKLRGARVIAIASQDKAQQLIELGADAVVDRDEPDLAEAIRAAAPRGDVDACVDVVGGAMFAQLVDCLRPGGRYSSAGCIAGPLVEFDLRQLIYKDLQLTGATVAPPGTFARIVSYIESGKVRALLAATYPLAELAKAQEAFLAKRHVGNIVVVV